METGVIVNFESFYPTLNTWYEVSAYPSSEGLSVYFKDISIRKQAEEQIRRSNERFEKVTEATNDAIWDYDVVHNMLFWGRGFKTLFGYDPETTDVSFNFLLSCIHADDALRIAGKIQAYMMDPTQYTWFEEYRFKKADGHYAYVIDRAVFIRNEQGVVTRVVGAMTDITYRKEYEESLRKLNATLDQRAKQLAVSNAELEQFAYIASHDLQEPLRMVSDYMGLLQKRYDGQLDEKAQSYIHFAVDGATRMKVLINDLLEFSKTSSNTVAYSDVHIATILEDVKKTFREDLKEEGSGIFFSELPTIKANNIQMSQLFQNLIGNAIKYRSEAAPQIHISATTTDTHWIFSVKDNGQGIDSKYYEKIFGMFQRLHSNATHKGTGIGLALCKKIVERHGGDIWLTSEPGKGSNFFFSIAKQA